MWQALLFAVLAVGPPSHMQLGGILSCVYDMLWDEFAYIYIYIYSRMSNVATQFLPDLVLILAKAFLNGRWLVGGCAASQSEAALINTTVNM